MRLDKSFIINHDIQKAWDYALEGSRGDLLEVIVEGFIDFEYEITSVMKSTIYVKLFISKIHIYYLTILLLFLGKMIEEIVIYNQIGHNGGGVGWGEVINGGFGLENLTLKGLNTVLIYNA